MTLDRTIVGVSIAALVLSAPARASAQSPRQEAAPAAAPFDGPPAPIPPAVSNRDSRGRLTIRAVRVDRPLTIDGRLDEEIYHQVPSFGDFIQQEPNEGQAATERTEAW